jgi:hypothetical protein
LRLTFRQIEPDRTTTEHPVGFAQMDQVAELERGRNIRESLGAPSETLAAISALRGRPREGGNVALLDRSGELQPPALGRPSLDNVEHPQAPALTRAGRRFGGFGRRRSVVFVHFAVTRSLVQQARDLAHPHTSLLMLHLHDGLVGPVEVERENGYLPSELAQGVADDSPK